MYMRVRHPSIQDSLRWIFSWANTCSSAIRIQTKPGSKRALTSENCAKVLGENRSELQRTRFACSGKKGITFWRPCTATEKPDDCDVFERLPEARARSSTSRIMLRPFRTSLFNCCRSYTDFIIVSKQWPMPSSSIFVIEFSPLWNLKGV